MVFNGYTPSALAPALIIVAVIVAILYLLRVRRRKVMVPYVGLWRQVMEQSSYRKWHDWVRRLISFLLWMVVAGLIAIALLDPREEEDDTARRHIVFIMDASASMMAKDTDSKCGTRFECAIDDARDLIDHMKPSDRAVIIEASGIVNAKSGPFQSDKAALDRVLRDMKPQATSADIQKALELARNLVSNRENAEIFLYTDGQFEDAEALSKTIPSNAAFEQRSFGSPVGNIYIEAFNVRRYIANRMAFEVFFKVHNGFEMPVTVNLKIYNLDDSEMSIHQESDHTIVAEKTLTIASGSSELRLYENLTLGTGRMAASIEIVEPKSIIDTLELDNIAYARIPDYAKPNILCITPGNLFLEAALLLNENYNVQFVKPNDKSIQGSQGKIELSKLTSSNDIVILDNSYHDLVDVDTSNEWSGKVIFINPEDSYAPFNSKMVENPVIERVNAKHDVSRWLALKNLNIAHSHVYSNISNSDMVMRAIEGPIMATHADNDKRFLAIGFSLVESDLIFRVGLPVLFINGIDWLMNENSEPVRGYPTGTAFHVSVPDNYSRSDVQMPDGNHLDNIPVYDHAVTIYGEKAGFYRISNHEALDAHPVEIAANFANPVESNLLSEPKLLTGRIHLETTLGHEEEQSEEETSWILSLLSTLPSSSQYLWVLALLIALGIISVEWLTYHRRWTV